MQLTPGYRLYPPHPIQSNYHTGSSWGGLLHLLLLRQAHVLLGAVLSRSTDLRCCDSHSISQSQHQLNGRLLPSLQVCTSYRHSMWWFRLPPYEEKGGGLLHGTTFHVHKLHKSRHCSRPPFILHLFGGLLTSTTPSFLLHTLLRLQRGESCRKLLLGLHAGTKHQPEQSHHRRHGSNPLYGFVYPFQMAHIHIGNAGGHPTLKQRF